MRVVFRADATRETGTGHVMRCWALAEEFGARGWQVEWQGEVAVPWLDDALRGANWPFQPPQAAPRVNADLVVVDSYTVCPTYRQELLDGGVPVIAVVDDFHRDLGPGSLWVNPGAPVPLGVGGRFLNGPDYVLIRREIRGLKQLRESCATREQVTFLLGGTDFAGLGETVDALDIPWTVYFGPASGVKGNSGAQGLPGGGELLRKAARSRLVVSTAGVSSWEMLHVGVPLALVLATENQRGNYEWMTSHGWAVGLGEGLKATESLMTALEAPPAAESRIDGLGARRVVDAALEAL